MGRIDFNCKAYVVDAIMGAGKTTAIINKINNSGDDERFIIITPYLEEVNRYIEKCVNKKLYQPKYGSDGTKLSNLKKLIQQGKNIVSTHSLFQKFDRELIDICRVMDYTLILDEVADVVSQHEIDKEERQDLLSKYVDINKETMQLIWKDEYKDYSGKKWCEEKRLCELGSLVIYNGDLMVWLFPIEVFNSFSEVWVLTYMFDAQLQRYYYDYYGLEYEYKSISNGKLVEYDKDKKYNILDYDKLINIVENKDMNKIGSIKMDLCKNWYNRNKNNIAMKKLKDNTYNFFFNICKSKSNQNIWTTFKEYKPYLKGKGYTKGFISMNMRATNEYRDRDCLAYLVNRYMQPFVRLFFENNSITVDEDRFALSEMLQFIWRSAIRDGKPINIYIPSERMRSLLKDWIKENSIESEDK